MKRLTFGGIALAYALTVAALSLPVFGVDAPSADGIIAAVEDRICRSSVAATACVGESEEQESVSEWDDVEETTDVDETEVEERDDAQDSGDEDVDGSSGGPIVISPILGGGGSSARDDVVEVAIHTEGEVVLEMDYMLPDEPAGTLQVRPTDGGDRVRISERSALATLIALDALSDEFEITDLDYYDSFGAFFLNCIEAPGVSSSELCGNWQYVVNGAYPSASIDAYELDDGDSLVLFFGSPREVRLERNRVQVGTEFAASVVEYDVRSGTYVPVDGYTVGITTPNPNDPFSPIEVVTATTDRNGVARFMLDIPGTFNVGLQEDFYYPSVELEVTDGQVGLPSARGGSLIDVTAFSVPAAVDYILMFQEPDGSFGSDLFTDWAAIALAAYGQDERSLVQVRRYLLNDAPRFTRVTDHERRALALMVLGIDPYDGTPVNHIEGLLGFYDGEQVGDPEYVNDDVFALLVLARAGYTTDDEVLRTLLAHVRENQRPDGSWEGDVDLTAATIQALSFFEGEGVEAARALARAYLKERQDTDAGWGNSFSSSWVLQAVAALDEQPRDWATSRANPLEYMADAQQDDGGLGTEDDLPVMRLWETSYAVPAVLGKSWPDLMESFEKQEITLAVTAPVELELPVVRTPVTEPAGTLIPAGDKGGPAQGGSGTGGAQIGVEEFPGLEADEGATTSTSTVSDQEAAAGLVDTPRASLMRFLAFLFTFALGVYLIARIWRRA